MTKNNQGASRSKNKSKRKSKGISKSTSQLRMIKDEQRGVQNMEQQRKSCRRRPMVEVDPERTSSGSPSSDPRYYLVLGRGDFCL
jgi:hypothetical protein